ncbi:MAG: hypothetical protein J7K30_00775 [Deltaproteobacteria bacterium]|nr:hypothetical protein [Deltaproteobacteria bacterium]
MKTGWEKINGGLQQIMRVNDKLSDTDLTLQIKRLGHLSKFTKVLQQRVGERLQNKSGCCDSFKLMDKYFLELKEIEKN